MRIVAVILTCWLGVSPAAAAEIDEQTGLIKAPGWMLVRAHCGGCHSHKLVTSQRADRQTWLDIIRWMQATQNLWQFDPETEQGILDYLAANYPPQPNRRRAPIPPRLMPPDVGKVSWERLPAAKDRIAAGSRSHRSAPGE